MLCGSMVDMLVLSTRYTGLTLESGIRLCPLFLAFPPSKLNLPVNSTADDSNQLIRDAGPSQDTTETTKPRHLLFSMFTATYFLKGWKQK